MQSAFPDEPLLGMFVGRTVRQLVLFCDYHWSPVADCPDYGVTNRRAITAASQWLHEHYPNHPMTALADAACADAEFVSESSLQDGQLKVFDAVADFLIWRFLRAELKGRPDEQIQIAPVRAQLSASLAGCFDAFNAVVLRVNSSEVVTSYKLPEKQASCALIANLKERFPLIAELLGYWNPQGDRQFYFFNSDFDYLSEYRGQSAE